MEAALPVAPGVYLLLGSPGQLGLGSWGDQPGSQLVPSLLIYQVTGDPGAVLWLEEIRQEVVRANQDTKTAQRSKWAGAGMGDRGGGETG